MVIRIPNTQGPSESQAQTQETGNQLLESAANKSTEVEPQESVAPEISVSGNQNLSPHGQTMYPLNGEIGNDIWKVTGPDARTITEDTSPDNMTPIDFCYWMFPLSHLETILSLTNVSLQAKTVPATTLGEILQYFGTLLMMTENYGARIHSCT